MLCLFPRERKVPQTYPHAHWLELHHMTLPKPAIGKENGITIVGLVDQNWFLGWGYPQHLRQCEEGGGVDKLREGEKRRQIFGVGGNQHSSESLIQFSYH